MRVEQEKVEQFHERNSLERAQTPTLQSDALAQHRYNIIEEELEEYLDAHQAGDLTGIADALADLLYVVLGAGVQHGINLQPIFEEVHRSNMTKTPLDPVTKKGGKGPGYEPPRLAALVLQQMLRITPGDPE